MYLFHNATCLGLNMPIPIRWQLQPTLMLMVTIPYPRCHETSQFTLKKTVCAAKLLQCRKVVRNSEDKPFLENKPTNYTVAVKMDWLCPICTLIQPKAWPGILLFHMPQKATCSVHKTSWKMKKNDMFMKVWCYRLVFVFCRIFCKTLS